MITYVFEISGTAADGQTWTVKGETDVDRFGMFAQAIEDAQRFAFMQLTNGRAIYGKPGVGCKGPYTVTRLMIEQAQ